MKSDLRQKAVAELMAEELKSIEVVVSIESLKVLAKIRASVKKALQTKQFPMGLITQTLAESMPVLTKASGTAFLVGMKRSLYNTAELELSARTTAISALRSFFNLSVADLDRLTKPYQIHLEQALLKLGAFADQRIQDAIVQNITEQRTVKDAIRNINQAFIDAGLDSVSSHRIETIFRTESQIAYSAGRWKQNQDNEYIRNNLWGYTYTAVGDDRTRPNHAALDGVTLPKDDPRWNRIFPPNGYNCRCQAIEVFEERAVHYPDEGGFPDKDFSFNPGKLLDAI